EVLRIIEVGGARVFGGEGNPDPAVGLRAVTAGRVVVVGSQVVVRLQAVVGFEGGFRLRVRRRCQVVGDALLDDVGGWCARAVCEGQGVLANRIYGFGPG